MVSSIHRSAAAAPSAASIEKRTETARKIEEIFCRVKPGQRLTNSGPYLERLRDIGDLAAKDYAALYKMGIKVTPEVKSARDALQKQMGVLQKAILTARSAKIIPEARLPWEGKVRKGETPLHWAVRNHEHQTALLIRYQVRKNRLLAHCERYAKSVKKSKVVKILAKPDIYSKLIPALEIRYVCEGEKILKTLIDDPDILTVIQDPDFIKILKDPAAIQVMNGLDVCGDLDAKGDSPLDHAFLQKDMEMVYCMLFPHFLANPISGQMFWAKVNDLKPRIAAMQRIDPNALSDVCKAAYLGNVDQLECSEARDFKTKDPKGLTPLYYALLGRQEESIRSLLPRTDLYTFTPEGHSYLDYAILSGNDSAFRALEEKQLPFKLGKEEEKFSYLVASGLLSKQLKSSAKGKDRIGIERADAIFGGINGTWLGLHLFNQWMGPSETAWTRSIENYASTANELIGYSRIWKSLPPRISQIGSFYLLGNNLVYPLCAWTARKIGLGSYVPEWHGLVALLQPVFPIDPSYVSKGYAALRVWSAVKPVLHKMPEYKNAFKSRPKDVLKGLAFDAFTIGTQAMISHTALR